MLQHFQDDCFVLLKPLPVLIPLNSHGHTCETGAVRMVTLFNLEGNY